MSEVKSNRAWRLECEELRSRLVETEAQERDVQELQDVLRRNGFVKCDIAACNCGSWHARYGWPERFHEIDDATRNEERNGEPLLARVNRIVARLAEATDGFNECMDDHATTLERLDAALAALKQHGIHVEENWCWCEPEVSKP